MLDLPGEELGELGGLVAPSHRSFARRRTHDLRHGVQSLGVVAPGAREGTALQEDRRPDPGPIVDGELADVEYHPGRHGRQAPSDPPCDAPAAPLGPTGCAADDDLEHPRSPGRPGAPMRAAARWRPGGVLHAAHRSKPAGRGGKRPPLDRLDHRPEVLHRRVQLDVVGRPEDQPAAAADRVAAASSTSLRTSSGVPNGSVCCSSMRSPEAQAVADTAASARPGPCRPAGSG